jgi:hypothetical protein
LPYVIVLERSQTCAASSNGVRDNVAPWCNVHQNWSHNGCLMNIFLRRGVGWNSDPSHRPGESDDYKVVFAGGPCCCPVGF